MLFLHDKVTDVPKTEHFLMRLINQLTGKDHLNLEHLSIPFIHNLVIHNSSYSGKDML